MLAPNIGIFKTYVLKIYFKELVMKKILILFVLWAFLDSFTFAEASNDVYSAVVKEMEEFTNGCGPGWLHDYFIAALNFLSGNVSACDQHDWDYYTLGMTKKEADDRFYEALRIGEWETYHSVIADVYWAAVHHFGDSSYRSAQMEAREEFKRIHNGLEWESYGQKWSPWDGRVW